MLHINYLCLYVSCAALPGRVGDKQVLSLQRFGCVRHGIIQHEMMHTLGFYHEHTRSDRDQYVKINWDNVKECKSLTGLVDVFSSLLDIY